jgi:hypothetical protein
MSVSNATLRFSYLLVTQDGKPASFYKGVGGVTGHCSYLNRADDARLRLATLGPSSSNFRPGCPFGFRAAF